MEAARTFRPFALVNELARRVPALSRAHLTTLAEIGALNPLDGHCAHRRDALWQIECAAREAGPLLSKLG